MVSPPSFFIRHITLPRNSGNSLMGCLVSHCWEQQICPWLLLPKYTLLSGWFLSTPPLFLGIPVPQEQLAWVCSREKKAWYVCLWISNVTSSRPLCCSWGHHIRKIVSALGKPSNCKLWRTTNGARVRGHVDKWGEAFRDGNCRRNSCESPFFQSICAREEHLRPSTWGKYRHDVLSRDEKLHHYW